MDLFRDRWSGLNPEYVEDVLRKSSEKGVFNDMGYPVLDTRLKG